MPHPRRNSALLALLLALAACQAAEPRDEGTARPDLALFGTIPIYWGEGTDMGDLLADDVSPDWVRLALERHFVLVPLDALEPDTLADTSRLLLAQPRPLAPSENVALDNWVRAGGEVLIFADPMLTRESLYPLGDRRRPQDVVLLSPILKRWGLDLRFDEGQADRLHTVDDATTSLPVWLAGEFAVLPGDGTGTCTLGAARVVADCRIGKGRAVLVADAAVLDGDHAGNPSPDQRAALESLAARAFTR